MPEKHWPIHRLACRAYQDSLKGIVPEVKNLDGSSIPLAMVASLGRLRLTRAICYPIVSDPTVRAYFNAMEQLKRFHRFLEEATEKDTEDSTPPHHSGAVLKTLHSRS